MDINIFEQASRNDLYFCTSKGVLNVSCLWKLPLTGPAGALTLDKLAKVAYAELKRSEQPSFVSDVPKTNPEAQLRFDILLHIIKVKKDEQLAEYRKAEVAAKRQKIMAILEQKQDEALSSSSIDELRTMLDAL